MVIRQEVKVEADSDGNSAKIIIESVDGEKVCFIEENVEGYVIITIAPGYHWGGTSGKAVV
jgi:hypothetical protein